MFLLTVLIFIAMVGAATAVGMKLYIRPKEAMERVVGVVGPADVQGEHPSLAFHEIIKRLGNFVPQSPKDVTVMQRRLIRAGIRKEGALKALYGAKVATGLIFPILVLTLMTGVSTDSGNRIAVGLAAAAVGFFGPNEYVRRLAGRRQHQIARGLPNALDLLVVCVESGLGLDQAILQVSKELEHAHPEISEEFGFVNLELKAGKRRVEALRNLAERTGVEDIRSLVGTLIQTDRFGTSVAQALRVHSDSLRTERRQRAEEQAAKTTVKMILPLVLFVMPSLIVVTVGPAIIQLLHIFLPVAAGRR